MQSVKQKILASIQGHNKGFAFCGKDFLHLGSRSSVDEALSSLCSTGKIRRVTRGIYDVPVYSDFLKCTASPDVSQVIKAMARKNGVTIQPNGALAANLLRLSTQVPAKSAYLTNGKSRNFTVGGTTVILKHVEPRELQPGSDIGVLVTQALRWLGKRHVGSREIQHLKHILDAPAKRKLRKDARYMEDWIWAVVQAVIDDNTTVEK